MVTAVARLFVSFVSAWTVAGITIFVLYKSVDRSLMSKLAFVGIFLGLSVAVLCWRATRNWAPRRAMPEELDNGFEVHLSYPYLTFVTFLGIVTFGIFLLPFWIQSRRWPKQIDPQGMTLRNGSRLAWPEITNITKRRKTFGGSVVSVTYDFYAGVVQGTVVPNSLAEGWGVVEFASRALGRDLLNG